MRWIYLRLLVTLALLAAGLGACSRDQPEPEPILRPVRYQRVEAGGLETSRTLAGVAKAGIEADLSFRVGGTVSGVNVDLGDSVRKGEVLAHLDAVDYELQVQEADRLDRLQFNLWNRAVGGDVTAIQTVLKIMERRARLLGLDQPQKVAPTNPQGDAPYHDGAMSDAELDARIAELEAKHRGDEHR